MRPVRRSQTAATTELGAGVPAGPESMPVIGVEKKPLLTGGLNVPDFPILHRLEMPVNKANVNPAVVNDVTSVQRGPFRFEALVSLLRRAIIDQQNFLNGTDQVVDFYASWTCMGH